MASSRRVITMSTATLYKNFVIAAFAALFVLFPVRFMAADAALPGNLSDGDKQCLGCHGIDGFKKELGAGNILSLHVQGDAFAKSVHGVNGCASCHADVDLKIHPQKPKTIASTREYSIAMAKICGGCHAEALKQNETSVHATLLASGNLSAPVCTDCHSAHAVSPKA